MPTRKRHEQICKSILGYSNGKVDRVIDSPIIFMPGKQHRKLFHTLPEAAIIGFLTTKSWQGVWVGCLHVLVDSFDTSMKGTKRRRD